MEAPKATGRQRKLRKRRASDEEDGGAAAAAAGGAAAAADAPPALSAADIKALQRSRQRRAGLDAAALATAGAPAPAAAAADSDDDDEAGGGNVLRAGFAAHRPEAAAAAAEDPRMAAFVEAQLAARLGRPAGGAEAPAPPAPRPRTLDERALEGAAPRQRAVDTELGAAFVAGVAEVALDVRHRMANIEATEAAKARLLAAGGAPGARDEFAPASGGGAARAAFPVRFGATSDRERERLAGAAARRAGERAAAEERRRKKDPSGRGGGGGW
jgi:hypothetical protein